MITRRDFSRSVLATGAALLASDSSSALPATKPPVSGIRGLVATPVTPFTSDDRIDAETFQKLVDFLIRHGFHVLAHPMHIGESLNLTIEERKLIAKLSVEAANGRVPVFIHTSSSSTEEVVALSRHAQSIGAQGVVVTTPYFWQPPSPALVDHFVTVASSIDISLIAYDQPRTGVSIAPEDLSELMRRCPKLIGMKGGDLGMEHFTEMCRVGTSFRPEFACFSGMEYLSPSMAAGGAGCFSPFGEVAPRLIKSLYDACESGDYGKARALQYKLSRLYVILNGGLGSFNFATAKPARAIMGRRCGSPRKPIQTLDRDAVRRLEAQLTQSGLLQDEPHGWA